MTDLDRLAQILTTHRGASRAVTIAALAESLALPRREVENLLQVGRPSLPFPVVAGAQGVYVATTAADLNHEIQSRTSRIRNISMGLQATIRKAKSAGFRYECGRFVDAPRQQDLINMVD
jgi:hypothetical protein